MATELGQAYVQIIPSAKGISGRLQKAIDPEATDAGNSAGFKIGGLIKKAVLAAGIGLAIKSAVEEGAKLEQSIGGIETLFKDTAGVVRKYADEAYKTVGMSANDYMENVTSFSASLLQSLGGDTDKAAEVANRAMIDMGDNANKMGTDMRDIQNAYQGFAKQNYTMLDNLKLGYGGTKREMERLLKDAQKLTGVKYNIDNLADVYTAIGVIQDQLEITGTTALEAEETISGSLNAMKSAFKNVLGNIAIGENVGPALKGLAKTISTFLFKNLLPMIANIVVALPGAIATFIAEAIPVFIDAGGEMLASFSKGISESTPGLFESIRGMLTSMLQWIQESLPEMLNSGTQMISNLALGLFEAIPNVIEIIGDVINTIFLALFDAIPMMMDAGFQLIKNMAIGLKENAPAIMDAIVNVLNTLLTTILEKYPEYFQKGWEIIGKLAQGLWDNLPYIITTLTDLVVRLIKTISSHLPQFIAKGLEMVAKLGIGLIKAIPGIVAKIPELVGAIVGAVGSLVGAFVGIGGDVVRGLWQGINNVKDWILDKISGFVDGIIGGIKGFFGIKSPSRVMANEIGKWLPPGLAVGIEGNTKPLTDTMENLSALTVDSFDADLSFNGGSSINTINGGSSEKLEILSNQIASLVSFMEVSAEENNENLIEAIVQSFMLVAGNMEVIMDERNVGKVVTNLKRKGLII